MNIEQLCDVIIESKNPFVHIYVGTRIGTNSKSAFFTGDGLEDGNNISPEVAAERVRVFMAAMPPGKYIATMMRSLQGGKSQREIPFEKEYGQQHSPGGHVSVGAIDAKWQAEMAAFKMEMIHKYEKKELSDRITFLEAELKERDSRTTTDLFLEILASKLSESSILKGVKIPANSPSSLSGQQEPAQINEDKAEELSDQANKAIEKIADGIGPDSVPLFNKLADLPADKLKKLSEMEADQIQQLASFL